MRFGLRRFALSLFLPMCLPASAVEVTGSVRSADGTPLAGAMVTATRADNLFAETIYAGADGGYLLDTSQTGKVTLRFRSPGYIDRTMPITLAGDLRLDVTLTLQTDPQALSDSLPASAHFTRIKIADPKERAWFQVECLTCHQLGNAYTRTARPAQRWREIMPRMLGFYGVTDAQWHERYARVLELAFDGRPHVVLQTHAVSLDALPAKIRQWKLPAGLIAHDVEYRPKDGRFYTVDQGLDKYFITDPRTNETETWDIPNDGMIQGGKFLALMGWRQPLGLTVPRAPHSVVLGPNGNLYSTDSVSAQIGEFNPDTRTYVGHDIGGKALYPHTLRFDGRGRVWFTISFSNQVGVLDTRDDTMRVIDLPPDTDRPQMPARAPYGIDINPVDGSAWYSSMFANRIGRVDPETFAVESLTPPVIGPRRMRFAQDGTLWIPDYGQGRLVKLDTKTRKYTVYPIPVLSPGEVEAPYAVGVHPHTQEVWITANMSDRMFRFLPKEERFVIYPLPTRGIFLRDFIFTPDGMVCAPSSPMPAPLTVEGGMQELLCLDPGGNLPLPQPAG